MTDTREQGFSYVFVMFLVAVTSVMSLRALQGMQVAERRDKESELLWRGMAYRDAIREYYVNGPGVGTSYPPALKELLDDTRFSNLHRHLRKLYRDPMTADGQWGLVHNANGQLIGVYSLSQVKPIKQAGFPEGLEAFTNAQHYSDWQFVYQPH